MYSTKEERIIGLRNSRNKYMKKRYNTLKEQHKCTKCGKQDVYTNAGNYLCYDCREKRNEYLRQLRVKHKNGA